MTISDFLFVILFYHMFVVNRVFNFTNFCFIYIFTSVYVLTWINHWLLTAMIIAQRSFRKFFLIFNFDRLNNCFKIIFKFDSLMLSLILTAFVIAQRPSMKILFKTYIFHFRVSFYAKFTFTTQCLNASILQYKT